ncbi:fatty acid desaturase family protein [Endothiovibrio diazotrophicus]
MSRNEPRLLTHREDRGAAALALLGPALMLLPFLAQALVEPPIPGGVYLLYWFLFWFAVSRNNYILHNHCHNPMSGYRPLNRLFDYALGLVTGMTAGTWRLTHNHGHHVTHKRRNLPNHWIPFVEEDEPLLREYSLTNAMRFSAKTTPTQWFGILGVSLERWMKGGFRARYYRYIFLEATAVWLVVVALAWIDWRLCLAFVVLPHFLAHFFSRYIDYLFHVCANPRKNYEYCFSCINPSYNWWCWNAGYHLAHHNVPKLHWSRLPELHIDLVQRHPQVRRLTRSYNYSGLYALLHAYWEHVTPRPRLV